MKPVNQIGGGKFYRESNLKDNWQANAEAEEDEDDSLS